LAKIGYKNGGDWRAKYKSAVLYLLPKEGWPAEVVAVPKTAGKDEWESKNGTFPRSAHVAFAAIEIYDIKDPLAKLETRLATKLKKMEE
jgi:hypothetical protein